MSQEICTQKFKFNLKRDAIDWRDAVYVPGNITLREEVDLRKWGSPIEDQLQLGSCTSNAMAGVYELLTIKDHPGKYIDLSRLFIYYNTRKLDGTIEEDSGATLRDTLKAVRKDGICSENLWPYNIESFTVQPSTACYEDAKKRNIKDYFKVTTVELMLDALNNNKPVMFGLLVYDSFNELSPTNTILRQSARPRWEAVGGHAMVMVGYNLSDKLFLVRNSFGANWCMNGYCWISFEYITTESQDAWVYDIELG